MNAMHFDALALLIMALCTIILVCHDHSVGFFYRCAVSFAGAMCFAQAMWLLGLWVPNAAGYPLPRLMLDIALALAAVTRASAVLIQHYARHRPIHPQRT